jgi:hypothetical protein
MEGVLRTRYGSARGALTTAVYMHPRTNTLVMDVCWEPAATAREPAAAATAAELVVSIWTLSTFNACCPPGQHSPAVVPTTAAVLDVDGTLVVTRDALPENVTSPRRIKAALALTVRGAAMGAGRAEHAENASSPVTAATSTLEVNPAAAFALSVVVSMVDNLHAPEAESADLATAAAKVASPGRHCHFD